MFFSVADDAAFTDLAAAYLELGLNKDDDRRARPQQRQ